MHKTIMRAASFEWIDVSAPEHSELEELARFYHLHETSVADCLEPDHLPKIERIGEVSFIVLRAYDDFCPDNSDTVQEMTRKLAIFLGPRWLLTIHRKEMGWLTDIKVRWRNPDMVESLPREDIGDEILEDLLQGAIQTYAKPIDRLLHQVDEAEEAVFQLDHSRFIFQEGYILRRKAIVYKHMLKLTVDIVSTIQSHLESHAPYVRDIIEGGQRLLFHAGEAVDSVNSMLNLHISLTAQRTNEASHRSNEIMRVLTVTSILFLPLNFLTGLYGMNFEKMPGAANPWGFWIMVAVMMVSVVGIVIAFEWKGWLHRDKSAKK